MKRKINPDDYVSKEEALARLFARWDPVQETEIIPLETAAGRVLAEDQFAGWDLPVFRASAMDGIAVKAEAFSGGSPELSQWRMGTDYVRADTGDDFPDEFDAVIAIEDVEILEGGGIALADGIAVKKGMNIRPRGSNVRKGVLLAPKGTVLSALDLAAIGMGGKAEVPVIKKPRVAFLPTGSELVPVGTPLSRGQNYDTNSVLAAQLLREMGAEPVMHAIVPDEPEEIRSAFDELLDLADVVIVNAGTSKGRDDLGTRMLAEKGEVLFHGVKAVPGRPMSMTVVEGKPVINLSGPPFAAFHSMDWAVRAVVCRYLGIDVPTRPTVQAVLSEPLECQPFFAMMYAILLEKDENGVLTARRMPKSSGTAASLTTEAVYVSNLGETPHAAGETITVELLR